MIHFLILNLVNNWKLRKVHMKHFIVYNGTLVICVTINVVCIFSVLIV